MNEHMSRIGLISWSLKCRPFGIPEADVWSWQAGTVEPSTIQSYIKLWPHLPPTLTTIAVHEYPIALISIITVLS